MWDKYLAQCLILLLCVLTALSLKIFPRAFIY